MKHTSFFAVLMLLVAALTWAQTKPTNQKTLGKNSATEDATQNVRASYSIFEQTIVDMPWTEVKKAAEENALVIIPIGVIEEHGPHMGLGADTYQAHLVAKMVKDKLHAQHVKAVVLPPIYWGVMQKDESGSYPGSLTVRPETLKALLMDVFTDVHDWGFQNVFLAALHGDRVHRKTVDEAIAEAEKTLGIDVLDFRTEGNGKPHPRVNPYTVEKPYQPDFHAGAVETAIMNMYFPGEVDLAKAKTLEPEGKFQPLGYVGDPAGYVNVNAKAEEAMVDYFTENIVNWLQRKQQKTERSGK